MKKSIFIALLFLFSLKYSFAQVYHSFPDSNASWSENYLQIGAASGGHTYKGRNGWIYILGGDTIINSVRYVVLKYKRTFAYGGWDGKIGFAGYDTTLALVFGAIREDSSKRIWFRNFLPSHEGFPAYCQQSPDYCFSLDSFPVDSDVLLYDFNLQVDDKIPWAPNGLGRKVVFIDSILLNDNSFRKRIAIFSNPAAIEYWIEGIGAEQGLFGAYMPPYIYGFTWQQSSLTCFKQNGQLLYDTTSAINEYECDIIFVHFSPEPGDSTIVVNNEFIYYSPSEKKIYFSFENKKYVNDDLIFYNRIGQEVFRKKIIEENFSVNVPTLVTGIYFYKIDDDYSKSLKGKFLIE